MLCFDETSGSWKIICDCQFEVRHSAHAIFPWHFKSSLTKFVFYAHSIHVKHRSTIVFIENNFKKQGGLKIVCCQVHFPRLVVILMLI